MMFITIFGGFLHPIHLISKEKYAFKDNSEFRNLNEDVYNLIG